MVVGAAGAVGRIVVQLLRNRAFRLTVVPNEAQVERLRTGEVSDDPVDDVPSNSFNRIVDTAGIHTAKALPPDGI